MFHKSDFPGHLNPWRPPQSSAIKFSSYQINMEMRRVPHCVANTAVRGDPRVHMNFVTRLKCPVKCSNALVPPKRNLWVPKGISSSRGRACRVCVSRGNSYPATPNIQTCPWTPEHLQGWRIHSSPEKPDKPLKLMCLIYLLFLVHINLHMFYSHLI